MIFSKSVYCQLYQLLLEASGFVKSSIFISNEILLRLLWSDSLADFIKWVGDPDYVSFCCCDAFILNSLFHFNFAKRLNFLITLPLFQSPFKRCTNQLEILTIIIGMQQMIWVWNSWKRIYFWNVWSQTRWLSLFEKM